MGAKILTSEQRAVLDLAAQLRRAIAERIHHYLVTYLGTPHAVNHINANAFQLGLLNASDLHLLEQSFWQQIQLFDLVSAIQFGSATGEYIGLIHLPDQPLTVEIKSQPSGDHLYVYRLDRQGKRHQDPLGFRANADPRLRHWYKRAQQVGQAAWSRIYQYATNASIQLGIRAVLPVRQSERWLGVLGCDLALCEISQFLRTLKIGRSGMAFIVEPSGLLVASSTLERPFAVKQGKARRLSAVNCGDVLIQAATTKLIEHCGHLKQIKHHTQLEFHCAQQVYLVDVLPYQDDYGLSWLIVLVMPEADFTAALTPQTRDRLYQTYTDLAKLNQELERRVTQRTAALKQSEERWQLAVRGSNDGIWDWNLQTREIFFSARWKETLGYQEHELANQLSEWLGRIHPDDAPRVKRAIAAHLKQQTPFYRAEYRLRCRDGSYKWILDHAQALWDRDGVPVRLAGSQTDISDRKQTEARLIQSAFSDFLTNLPNRVFFIERLRTALRHLRTDSDSLAAVLYIDLDRFKIVNDSLGHTAGDRLLKQIGRRLRGCIRTPDLLARLGGDEFAVLLREIQDPSNSITVAERILNVLKPPLHLHGQAVSLSASIGIAFSRNLETGQRYTHGTDLLRDADLAMFHAKRQGGGCYALFDPYMHLETLSQLQLETELRQAIADSQLQLYYQPIVKLGHQQIVGFEVLVRWQHPRRGLLLPKHFIASAEETGLIVPLGEWVLRSACQQRQQWQQHGLLAPEVSISVNVSGQQFARQRMTKQVEEILRATDLAPTQLCLEITESAIAEDLAGVADQLNLLREMGVRIAIDDFGTGYSSLARLQSFTVDTLKLDRSFMIQMSQKARNQEFVKAIVKFAQSLEIDVVAEGVETRQQYQLLQGIGCEYAQGFFFSRPVDAVAVTEWFKTRQVRALEGKAVSKGMG